MRALWIYFFTPLLLIPLRVSGHNMELGAINSFFPMPENVVVQSTDGTTYATYATPTTEYRHGILGDSIEASELIVKNHDTVYRHMLPKGIVFEDIAPRLFDVDMDGSVEIITIRSEQGKGAGIAIYKIYNNAIIEYAYVKAIGTAHRWLNIAAIADLDNDGIVELAWVETPHIGGILKVANIQQGQLVPTDSVRSYSNHAIGSRNLCLSVLTQKRGRKKLYVSSQGRDSVIGFELVDEQWRAVERIPLVVDFGIPLSKQYDFKAIFLTTSNCL